MKLSASRLTGLDKTENDKMRNDKTRVTFRVNPFVNPSFVVHSFVVTSFDRELLESLTYTVCVSVSTPMTARHISDYGQ